MASEDHSVLVTKLEDLMLAVENAKKMKLARERELQLLDVNVMEKFELWKQLEENVKRKEQKIREQDQLLQKITFEVEEKNEERQQAETQMNGKIFKQKEMEAQLKAKEKKLNSWYMQLLIKNDELDEMEAKVKAKTEPLKEMEAKVEAKTEQLKAKVKAKTEQLKEMEAKVKAKTEQLKEMEAKVKAKTEQLKEMEAKVEARRTDFDCSVFRNMGRMMQSQIMKEIQDIQKEQRREQIQGSISRWNEEQLDKLRKDRFELEKEIMLIDAIPSPSPVRFYFRSRQEDLEFSRYVLRILCNWKNENILRDIDDVTLTTGGGLMVHFHPMSLKKSLSLAALLEPIFVKCGSRTTLVEFDILS